MPKLKAPLELRKHSDLSKLMELHGLDSDRDLAAVAGLHHSTVHRIRTGRHTHLDTASKIADALGVAVGKLFRPEGQNNSTQLPK